jgi:hypothetical protein
MADFRLQNVQGGNAGAGDRFRRIEPRRVEQAPLADQFDHVRLMCPRWAQPCLMTQSRIHFAPPNRSKEQG